VNALTGGVTHTSVAFDGSNRPAISYYHIHAADLKFAQFDGSAWQTQRIASRGAQGLYTQLYFPDDGLANIIYYNRKSNLVMKVTGSIATGWTAEQLQAGGGRYITLAVSPVDETITYSWFEPGVAKLRVADV